MAIDFSSINLEIIDINVNVTPDIFINQNGVTFSKRVLEDLNYPQTVQYGTDPAHHVFGIRPCKSNEQKATVFCKPRGEQNGTLSSSNRNLHDSLTAMMPNYDSKTRYKVTGEYDAENRVMLFDLSSAVVCEFRASKE